MISQEEQDRRKHNHLCRDCGAVLYTSNVLGAYCEATHDHRVNGRCEACWEKIGEFWALESADAYDIEISSAKHDFSLDLASWFRPYALVSCGTRIPLPFIFWRDISQKESDGSFRGCNNQAWILTEEEVNHYLAINQMRADEKANKQDAADLVEDAKKTIKQARKADFKKRLGHTFTIEDIEDEGGKTKCIHHTILFTDGVCLQFSERNVFDFGNAINPEYPIAHGKEPGGLVSFDKEKGIHYFMDFNKPIYQAGDYIGEDAIEKDYADWTLPTEYNVRKHTSKFDFFGFGSVCNTLYEVIDKDGAVLSMGDTSLEAALRNVHHILRIKVVSPGGWDRVRNLTPHEEEAYNYLLEFGCNSQSPIRMYNEKEKD